MIVINKITIWRVILIITILATVTFIWSNSLESASESSEMSDTVVEKIKPIIDPKDKIDDDLFVTIVRKAAHFSEFALLGGEMYLLFATFEKWKNRKLPFALIPIGLPFVIAVADECLQLTAVGRSCEFTDMMIDLAGVITGIMVLALIRYICIRVFAKAE